MIVGAVLDMFFGFLSWIVDSIPQSVVPSWLGDSSSLLNTVLAQVGSMSVWLPIPLIVTVGSALLLVYGIAFGVKLVRIVISLLTLGGGSAA